MTNDPWLQRWEQRYAADDYAFGTAPNEYLKEQIDKLKPGSILFAAEGEGRNAVYAALRGWTVSAFDISNEGKKKALRLAEQNKVSIDYQVGQLPDLDYTEEQFDAIGLIYAHFPADIKSRYHRMLSKLLRKDGIIIFEAFGKNHLPYRLQNERVGGPTDLDSLFSIEEIKADFENYDVIELLETVVDLNEGPYHSGKGSVVRFAGRKR